MRRFQRSTCTLLLGAVAISALAAATRAEAACTQTHIPNCASCTGAEPLLCAACERGYVLATDSTACNEPVWECGIPGCISCDSEGVCVDAAAGYRLTAGGSAQQCLEGCATCQEYYTMCDSCLGNYVRDPYNAWGCIPGACTIPHCTACSAGQCTACDWGYAPSADGSACREVGTTTEMPPTASHMPTTTMPPITTTTTTGSPATTTWAPTAQPPTTPPPAGCSVSNCAVCASYSPAVCALCDPGYTLKCGVCECKGDCNKCSDAAPGARSAVAAAVAAAALTALTAAV